MREEELAHRLGRALDDLIQGRPTGDLGDETLEELLQVARMRLASGRSWALIGAQHEEEVWRKVRVRLYEGPLNRRRRPRGPGEESPGLRPERAEAPALERKAQNSGQLWPRLLTAGAVAVLLVAALGPVPASGLANHPAVRLVRWAGEHAGVFEISALPPAPPPSWELSGVDVSPAQAAQLMGLPVRELAGSPLGFRLMSSRYFARSLTAEEGGVYILAYARDWDEASQATVLIYQERADGTLLAVAGETTMNITLDDGAPAAYIEGSWRVANGMVVWDGSGAQTLVFDRGGLRTVIQYVQGPPVTVEDLKLIARSLVPASLP